MIFGVSVMTLVIALGASVDYYTLNNSYKRSQSVADTAALHAAIFVKNHDRLPENSDEGYMDGHTYTAAELGHDYKGWVEGGAENVRVTFNYDDTNKEAIVTVEGATIPTFMQVTGRQRLPFRVQSTVSYLQVDEKFPASITLVLDNSGSMSWDDKLADDPYQDENGNWYGDSPADAIPRIEGLRSSVTSFKNQLNNRLGNEDDSSRRTVRMGMIPYNSEVISSGQQEMSWGYVLQSKINDMAPGGATNSNPPMALARDWLEDEDAYHESEANAHNEDHKEPLKFVIFMTDGQNTAGNYEVIPGNTGYWYGQINGRWYYARQPYSDFIEGTLQLDTDRVTIEKCQEMKDDGVQIFTIGYALEVGAYNENNYTGNGDDVAKYVTHGMSQTAYSLLRSCASEEDNFIKAENAEKLKSAFDSIQNAIVEELIRIKS